MNRSYCFFTVLLIGCNSPCVETKKYSGFFEGSEPFWSLKIKDNQFLLHCNNKNVKGTLDISEKSAEGESIAFFDHKIYGVINHNWYNRCELAVTEKDSLPYEIYFSFENITYKGCGEFN